MGSILMKNESFLKDFIYVSLSTTFGLFLVLCFIYKGPKSFVISFFDIFNFY
jgi:hypothetical protein